MLLFAAGCTAPQEPQTGGAAATPAHRELGQAPTWSGGDMAFFLHGSMSTEVVPEDVLRAFILSYPDLFPGLELSPLGLIS